MDLIAREALANAVGLLEALPAPVALIDREGKIAFVNDAWCGTGVKGFWGSQIAPGSAYLEVLEEAFEEMGRNSRDLRENVGSVIEGRVACFSAFYQDKTADPPQTYLMVLLSPGKSFSAHVLVGHWRVAEELAPSVPSSRADSADTHWTLRAKESDQVFLRESEADILAITGIVKLMSSRVYGDLSQDQIDRLNEIEVLCGRLLDRR